MVALNRFRMGVHSLDQLLNGCVYGATIAFVFSSQTFQNYLEGRLRQGGIYKSWIFVAMVALWVMYFSLYFCCK